MFPSHSSFEHSKDGLPRSKRGVTGMGTGDTVGIDIGTVSIALALVDSTGQLTYRDHCFHNGNIHAALKAMLGKLPVQEPGFFGVVAEKGREFFRDGVEVKPNPKTASNGPQSETK